ncbi:unnamed protein product [Mytilus coruscus]|uniref:Uncharacterized protein n=1 Tax=Mytilus coruscus TaxID=42192 RepID=A0A6J8B1E7_MYTCO|nr:unnamed protein product [Mytilus coruscus]
MMNENPEQEETSERSERAERDTLRSPSKEIFKKPKPKDTKRVAAGKKGAEAKKMKAELRKKEEEKFKKENAKFKMASEKSDLPQITKDSDTETDYESNPLVERNSGSKVDYKFVLFFYSALAMMLGGAITNAFAFSGSNYLFSHMGSNANEEKIRHDKAIEKLEKAQQEWNKKRIQRLDFLNEQLQKEHHAEHTF